MLVLHRKQGSQCSFLALCQCFEVKVRLPVQGLSLRWTLPERGRALVCVCTPIDKANKALVWFGIPSAGSGHLRAPESSWYSTLQ